MRRLAMPLHWRCDAGYSARRIFGIVIARGLRPLRLPCFAPAELPENREKCAARRMATCWGCGNPFVIRNGRSEAIVGLDGRLYCYGTACGDDILASRFVPLDRSHTGAALAAAPASL